jgi:acyl carrier protein
MTPEQIKTVLLEELINIAPELASEDIPDNADLRDEMDLDSMDFLNWVTAIHRRLGVDIPELDYPRLSALAGAVEYVARKLA